MVISLNEPVSRSLHAGAVVSPDVKDQRVVGDAQVVDRLDHPADLVIAVLLEAGEDFHLAGVELLLVRRQFVPGGELRVPGVSLASAGITPSFFCRANVSLRSLSQPWSNLPLYLSAHSLGT